LELFFKPKRKAITYDLYIICSADRFHETDLQLAKRINRPFYFVRTKFDQDIENKEKILDRFLVKNADKDEINELSIELKENIKSRLASHGLKPEFVYTISADMSRYKRIDNRQKYDFPLLIKHITENLETPEKQNALIFSLSLLGKDIIDMKSNHLYSRMHSNSVVHRFCLNLDIFLCILGNQNYIFFKS
jgi:hypothetical protein